MELRQVVFEYLNTKGWVVLDDMEEQISLLGSGESNTNFLITAAELYGEARYLFRINHSSRLGLADQIEYEFAVLQAVRRSGVTPRPFYCDSEPGDKLGNGVMLMEYLEGRPLDCDGDWEVAAEILAKIHSVPVDTRLIAQKSPVSDSVRECRRIVEGFGKHDDEILMRLGKYVEKLEDLVGEAERFSHKDSPVIINGAVCPSDFLIDDEGEEKIGMLVDWECGVVSSRYVDIGQFFAQASLARESGYCRDEDERCRFAEVYIDVAGLDVSVEEFVQRANLFEQAAMLRSTIWNSVALRDMK